MQQIIILSAILAVSFAAPISFGLGAYVPLSKSTLTSSSQIVNHGNTHVLHTPVIAQTPVVHTPVVHTPVVHAPVVHTPVYTSYSAPVVAYKSGDSAITHHSSTVHSSVPLVNSLPVYSYYH